jgi:diguanylate cyclase (GGDEF)-like protein
MLQPSFDELKSSGELPTPTGVGMQILRMTQGEEFSTEEVGRVISTDPALAGRLIKLANSAESGAAEPISTIEHAMMRLGIRAVRNVALGLSLITGHRTGSCPAFDYDGFWARSLARAVAAQGLAGALRCGVPAETYILGLLSDIGSLALASVHPRAFAELLGAHGGGDRDPLIRAEKERFGIDHLTVSALMLREWGLPEGFALAAQTHGAFDLSGAQPGLTETPALLKAADVLARLLVAEAGRTGEEWRALMTEFSRAERVSGLDREPFRELCNRIARAWRDWGRMLSIPTESDLEFLALERQVKRAMEAAPRSRVQAARPAPPAAEPEERHGSELRVLAVDDDPVSLKVLERHLMAQGFAVRTARDGNQARELAEVWEPHLVIADWHMPGMTGVELCRSLRERPWGRDMHFLLLTGNDAQKADEDDIIHAFEEAQVDDYVTKPFRPRILMARIKAGCRVIHERIAKEQAVSELREKNVELEKTKRKLTQVSYTDALTGLPNRRLAMERLAQSWASSLRHGTPFSVIMCDIDHFKRINDENGHDAGDAALREVAVRFRAGTREEELVCRIGGEEFLILCENTTLADAYKVAERLRKAVASTLVQVPGGTRQVTLSLGVAARTPRMTSFEDLLKVADQAVYAAKEGGRNCTVIEAEGGDFSRRSA